MQRKYILIVGIIIAIIAALFFNVAIVDAQCAFPSVDGLCGQGTPFKGENDGTGMLILILIIVFMWLGKTNGE